MMVVVVTGFDIEMFVLRKICDVRVMTTDFICVCAFLCEVQNT